MYHSLCTQKNGKNILKLVLILLLISNGALWEHTHRAHPHAYAAGVVSPQALAVYGQAGSFTTNGSGVTATTLSAPRNAIEDSSGNLYVSDFANNRVLYYASGSTTATRVYGQGGSFTSNTANNGGVSANSLNGPQGLALDSSGNLYIADNTNNRVLYFPSGSASTTATRVYGQGGSFTSNDASTGTTGLSGPNSLALDSSGNLYVADTTNNRVLYYPSGTTTATVVYGQAGSFTTNTANNGGVSATSMSHDVGVTLDSSNNLYVADAANNRVLYFPSGSTTATRVYGQGSSFTTSTANSGGVSATSMNVPVTIAADGSNNLYITDAANNRVLYFPSGSTTATRVYGQGGSFTSNTANNGGISATNLNGSYTVYVDSSGNIYVADTGNNRILKFQISLKVTSQPPASTPAGSSFSTIVSLIDVGSGTVFSDFSGTVTAAIKSGTGTSGATLGGTTSNASGNGIMTLTALTINKSGSGYVLTLSYPGVGSVNTNTFTIAASTLAGYWPFNEGSGTSTTDWSPNGNTGTITGASWTIGQVNSALSFNGTSNYVSMGTPTALQFGTGSFTAIGWFKTTNTSGVARLFDQGVGNFNGGFSIDLNVPCAGCVAMVVGGSGSSSTDMVAGTSTSYADGNWHQVAMVINQTAQTAQLYVDDVAQSLSSSFCGTASGTTINIASCTSLTASTTDPFVVGVYTGASGTFQYFNGSIDEVRLYNSALTSAQIQTQYTNDTTTLEGYWPFDENTGTIANDYSPNSNAGAITGGTWSNSGQVNGALGFNGSSDNVLMGNQSALQFGINSFTIISWFKTTATGNYQRIVSMGNYNYTSGYLLGLGPSGTSCAGCVGGSIGGGGTLATSLMFYGSTAFNDGNWHQVAMVINQTNSTAQIYVDGIAQTVTTQSGSCGTASGTSVNIAACTSLNASSTASFTLSSYNQTTQYFNGSLDEVRTYDRALTSAQVTTLYANDTNPTPAGYWPLNEDNGTTTYDATTNNDTGTITGATWTTGKINSGLSFNGTSNYVSMGTPTGLQFASTSSITTISWFKTTSTTFFTRMMSEGVGNWKGGFTLDINVVCTGCIGGFIGGGTQATSLDFGTTAAFNDGNWHQAVMVVNRTTNLAQIYIDGVAQALTTASGTCGTASGTTVNIASCISLTNTTTDPFTVGAYTGTNGPGNYFSGSLDEPRIYGVPLSSQEVLNRYTSDVNTLSEYASNATFSGAVHSTATYTLPITVNYQLTPAPGWSLTITSTTLTSGSNTLPTTASKITSVANTCTATCTPTTMTNTISSFPIAIPAGTTAPTAVKFFGTAAGTGTGAYTVTPTISVTIPITAKPGAYTSTVTLTAATGP